MPHKGRRPPQRATLDAVFATVRRLYYAKPDPAPVTRAELHAALALPGTTIDDRIRTLVATKRIERPSPGKYKPVMTRCSGDGNVQVTWASGRMELKVRGYRMDMTEADAAEVIRHLSFFLGAQAKPGPSKAAGRSMDRKRKPE